jgi:hypothetical protein
LTAILSIHVILGTSPPHPSVLIAAVSNSFATSCSSLASSSRSPRRRKKSMRMVSRSPRRRDKPGREKSWLAVWVLGIVMSTRRWHEVFGVYACILDCDCVLPSFWRRPTELHLVIGHSLETTNPTSCSSPKILPLHTLSRPKSLSSPFDSPPHLSNWLATGLYTIVDRVH